MSNTTSAFSAKPQPAGVPSPCISVCIMNPNTGLCNGCTRTIDEIGRWGSMHDVEKRAVWRAINERKANDRKANENQSSFPDLPSTF